MTTRMRGVSPGASEKTSEGRGGGSVSSELRMLETEVRTVAALGRAGAGPSLSRFGRRTTNLEKHGERV